MPTYVYKCRKCGHQFDAFQSIMAPPLKRCPKCRGAVARMLTTGSGIIFKGSGFYQTDYKKSALSSPEKSEAQKPAGAKTESSKTESGKPEKPAK